MLLALVKKIIGSRNDRLLKKLEKSIVRINDLEAEISALDDAALQAKTAEFRSRIQAGSSLDELLPEAFAVVREASKRLLHMRHFDVQLIGGMVLHNGKIAEMRTGEGKTLVATLPAYLNALNSQGVHVITVNDYLARRDAQWNEPLFNFLGMTVGVIVHGLNNSERQAAYNADITYGTNNEFGFDYLRDNMVFSADERVQRPLAYAIVDEVDSILIDEARTPLIISGADQDSSELYQLMNQVVPNLKKTSSKQAEDGDFYVDEKARQVFLTEKGHGHVEELLLKRGLIERHEQLYDASHIGLLHHLHAGLKAFALFKRDVDYIVRDDQVIIVDEHTGRTMPGRRWSDGIHQAVEAKEQVSIQNESQTLASITFQNYFRMYKKLAGMTGTADTEAFEFQDIYHLETVVIPTNRSSQRDDKPDLVYLNLDDKFAAIVEDVQSCLKRKQPVLVGTASIETSEYVSQLLARHHIKHQVLNAKHHEREAEIIAEAGRPGAVTIATNMAGRGTDIVLGGSLDPEADDEARAVWQKRHEQVLEAGGLHIIGTERHESRRIDNQLRGRAGRQGDPGSTQFYLSLKDNLMRIFVSERISQLLNRLGLENNEAITHPWVTRAIENAQKTVESHNFDIRKQLLDFDDVSNDQRRVIYERRNALLESADIAAVIETITPDAVKQIVDEFLIEATYPDTWNIEGLTHYLHQECGLSAPVQEWLDSDPNLQAQDIYHLVLEMIKNHLKTKEAQIGAENMRHLERTLMMSVLDSHWKDHLSIMEYLRQSIHLRSYAQKDPKQEYKREAFVLFTALLETVKKEVLCLLSLVQATDQSLQAMDEQWRQQQSLQELHFEHPAISEQGSDTANTAKVGRNEPCPCGSGRKYKVCHGQINA